jgi:hypothetical protein
MNADGRTSAQVPSDDWGEQTLRYASSPCAHAPEGH